VREVQVYFWCISINVHRSRATPHFFCFCFHYQVHYKQPWTWGQFTTHWYKLCTIRTSFKRNLLKFIRDCIWRERHGMNNFKYDRKFSSIQMSHEWKWWAETEKCSRKCTHEWSENKENVFKRLFLFTRRDDLLLFQLEFLNGFVWKT
jgi:hypothetical protein